MGMPACTITSQTAHGGVVTVGFPQVLIGFLPASRIGDLHVCPMVTGVVPHVGGPFILGSPTVLVGMMPQSRVTDQLTCVGPPDVAVMGCETVLVGMAGGGGAMGAAAGISAMGAPVPMQTSPAAATGAETAEVQQDGTIKYSAPAGEGLPPYTHTSAGHPDLPGKAAQNFQTAQPVTVPPGTTLYRFYDPALNGAGCYWSSNVFDSEEAWREACAVKPEWPNKGQLIAAGVVQPPGLKAWIGAAAKQGALGGGGTQLWVPEGALSPSGVLQTAWAAAAQQAQGAEQALQAAQAAANEAQQAAAKGEAAAQEAAAAAQKQEAEAAQKAVQEAKQAAQQATKQAQKAQQASQAATQEARLASQQAQQATQQGKAAAEKAADEAQQTAQQAQKTAQAAEQSAQQAQNSAQQAQNVLPKGLP